MRCLWKCWSIDTWIHFVIYEIKSQASVEMIQHSTQIVRKGKKNEDEQKWPQPVVVVVVAEMHSFLMCVHNNCNLFKTCKYFLSTWQNRKISSENGMILWDKIQFKVKYTCLRKHRERETLMVPNIIPLHSFMSILFYWFLIRKNSTVLNPSNWWRNCAYGYSSFFTIQCYDSRKQVSVESIEWFLLPPHKNLHRFTSFCVICYRIWWIFKRCSEGNYINFYAKYNIRYKWYLRREKPKSKYIYIK